MAKNAWHTFFWMQWFLHVLPKMLDVWIISLTYMKGQKIATFWWWNSWCRYSDIPYTYMVHLVFIAYFYTTTTPPHPKKKTAALGLLIFLILVHPTGHLLGGIFIHRAWGWTWQRCFHQGPRSETQFLLQDRLRWGRGPWYTRKTDTPPKNWWWADAKFGSFGFSPFVKSSMFLGAMFVLGSVYFAVFGKNILAKGHVKQHI